MNAGLADRAARANPHPDPLPAYRAREKGGVQSSEHGAANSSLRPKPSDNPFMPFDPLVTNAGRLRILTALAAEPAQAFVRLRTATGLTDGNLATHARRLASAGFVMIEKTIADGKPLTTLHLTPDGRAALASHARAVMSALEPAEQRASMPVDQRAADSSPMIDTTLADDWVD